MSEGVGHVRDAHKVVRPEEPRNLRVRQDLMLERLEIRRGIKACLLVVTERTGPAV